MSLRLSDPVRKSLGRKCPFWADLVHKNVIASLGWDFVVIFFCLELEIPFLGKLVQKIKIVSLSWNVVPRLILICQIKWWVHCFYFRSKTLFWVKFGLKNQNCQFKLKLYLLLSLIQVCRIQCWCSLFLFLTGNTLFGQIWSKNSKLSV